MGTLPTTGENLDLISFELEEQPSYTHKLDIEGQRVAGMTDKMVVFKCDREEGVYTCVTALEPLEKAANVEKKIPREWINAAGNGVEPPFLDYVLPLIQGDPDVPKENGMPRFAKLKKVLAKAE